MYRWLSIVLLPFCKLLIAYRLLIKKEDPLRYKEKFAEINVKRSRGKLIWFHAASVGEMKAIAPVLEKFSEADYNILVTSGTLTSAKIFATLNIKNAVHQFAPFDALPIVKKFLNYWKPDLGIFVESEIWPNLIIEASKHFKLALVNARMSGRSYKMWSRFLQSARYIFSKFSCIIPCSENSSQRYQVFSNKVTAEKINIKYCASPLSYDELALAKLKTMFAGRKILLCASTHSNEEELILKVFKQIKEKIPEFSLIIIPRHPHRGKEIYKIAGQISPNAALRSEGAVPEKLSDIYIADTIGELGIFYRLCDLVFVGGSLIKHGGQNILEPARLNSCILTGPYHHNFTEIVEDFKNNKAIIEVNDVQELAKVTIRLLQNTGEMRQYIENAYKLMSKEYNLVERIFYNLQELLNHAKS